ncbi:unnamed protein product [Choristocarpus tenellus]
MYAQLGARSALVNGCRDLPSRIELRCDGKVVHLPETTASIIILNINSYAGGSKLWAVEERGRGQGVAGRPSLQKLWAFERSRDGNYDTFLDYYEDNEEREEEGSTLPSQLSSFTGRTPSIHDGILEIVAVEGVLHLGQIHLGLSQALSVTQCRELQVRTLSSLPMQVDGEPWKQPPSEITVKQHNQAAMLRPSTPDELAVAETLSEVNKVITAAQRRGVISLGQAQVLMSDITKFKQIP